MMKYTSKRQTEFAIVIALLILAGCGGHNEAQKHTAAGPPDYVYFTKLEELPLLIAEEGSLKGDVPLAEMIAKAYNFLGKVAPLEPGTKEWLEAASKAKL